MLRPYASLIIESPLNKLSPILSIIYIIKNIKNFLSALTLNKYKNAIIIIILLIITETDKKEELLFI
jgi:hypothetical protein